MSQRHGTASQTRMRTKNGGMLPPVIIPLASWLGVMARGDIHGLWAAAVAASAGPHPQPPGPLKPAPWRRRVSVIGGGGGRWGWVEVGGVETLVGLSVISDGGRHGPRRHSPRARPSHLPPPDPGRRRGRCRCCHRQPLPSSTTSVSWDVGVVRCQRAWGMGVISVIVSVVCVCILVLPHIVGGRRQPRPSLIAGGWSARGQRRTTDTPTLGSASSVVRSTNAVM